MGEQLQDTCVDSERAVAEEQAALFPARPATGRARRFAPPRDGGKSRPEADTQARAPSRPQIAPTALCLSGGGIRSATFSLGVLQALAAKGWLTRFDYLSTVSGGGFIGGWLTRWRTDQGAAWEQAHLTETEDDFSSDLQNLHRVRRLRNFSNYLAPSVGLTQDGLTFANSVLRKFGFNLVFWVLVFVATALAARTVAAVVAWAPEIGPAPALAPFLAKPVWFATLVPPGAIMLLVALASVLALPFSRSDNGIGDEDISSRSARWLLPAIAWFALFLLFAAIPQAIRDALAKYDGFSARAMGITTLAAGIVATISGYWARIPQRVQRRAEGIADKAKVYYLEFVSAAFIVSLAIATGYFAGWLFSLPGLAPLEALRGPEGTASAVLWTALVFALAVGAALFFAKLVGANRSSLHSLYAVRLIRAYLGSAVDERDHSGATDYSAQDDVPMHKVRWQADDGTVLPLFPVINMTLNLKRGRGQRVDWQQRRGASFTATPLRVGSHALGTKGYAPIETLVDRDGRSGMTLGRAMTISGAAASPNMGYHSRPIVAAAMAILNVRLGWWFPNPVFRKRGESGEYPALRTEPPMGAFHILKEAMSRLADSDRWLYLSDGGHFDNLGLYEMVRRRCRQILVVDAGCDNKFEYADLHNAVRKIQIDFGIPIDLPSSLPGQPGAGETQRFVAARIRYSAVKSGAEDGILILVKPVMLGNEPPGLAWYREQSRTGTHAFPHHSTGDQFFDETQFESYRLLGAVSGNEVLAALHKDTFTAAAPGFDKFYPALDDNDQPKAMATGALNRIPAALQNETAAPPPRQAPPATASRDLIEGVAGAVRSMSASELLLKTIGVVAAVTLTVKAADKAPELIDDFLSGQGNGQTVGGNGNDPPAQPVDGTPGAQGRAGDPGLDGDPANVEAALEPIRQQLARIGSSLSELEGGMLPRSEAEGRFRRIGTSLDNATSRLADVRSNVRDQGTRIGGVEGQLRQRLAVDTTQDGRLQDLETAHLPTLQDQIDYLRRRLEQLQDEFDA